MNCENFNYCFMPLVVCFIIITGVCIAECGIISYRIYKERINNNIIKSLIIPPILQDNLDNIIIICNPSNDIILGIQRT